MTAVPGRDSRVLPARYGVELRAAACAEPVQGQLETLSTRVQFFKAFLCRLDPVEADTPAKLRQLHERVWAATQQAETLASVVQADEIAVATGTKTGIASEWATFRTRIHYLTETLNDLRSVIYTFADGS